MKHLLPFLAPYVSVLVFWCILESAWLAILVYHAQILFWSWRRLSRLPCGWNGRWFVATAVPCALAGPLVYALMPYLTGGADVAVWLARYGLEGGALLAMIPYFGLVHPALEQAHWSGLRTSGWWSHAAFAGYHAIVLYTLLGPVWLVACVAVLFSASAAWSMVAARTGGGLLVPLLGHALADGGIVLAAWALVA